MTAHVFYCGRLTVAEQGFKGIWQITFSTDPEVFISVRHPGHCQIAFRLVFILTLSRVCISVQLIPSVTLTSLCFLPHLHINHV